MFKLFKKLFKSKLNERGSVLSTAIIVMVVLSSSIAAVSAMSIQNYTITNIKLESVENENQAKRIIQQSITEFEIYILNTSGDFQGFLDNETTAGINSYGVFVEKVSGTGDFLDFGTNGTEAFRFSFTLANGNSMVMYSFAASNGTETAQLDPFDFTIVSNETLLVNGGRFRNSSFFARDVHIGYVSPYHLGTTPSLIDDTGDYPDFNGGGVSSSVKYTDTYTYCPGTCFQTTAVPNGDFIFENSEALTVIGTQYETGAINDGTQIVDFFGDFFIDNEIINYVHNDAPTASLDFQDLITLDTMASVINNNYTANSAGEFCYEVGKGKNKVTVCEILASNNLFTDLTSNTDFDPLNDVEYINGAAIYNGNLEINQDFTMKNLETEGFIVNGNLTFNNADEILVEGMFVVLGELSFTGSSVIVDGGFYVQDETIVNFDPGKGFIDSDNQSTYKFTLLAKDNVLIESLWESHSSSSSPARWNWVIYTEESIYVDAVNSRLNINGIFFAAARGYSGNNVPMKYEDDPATPSIDESLNYVQGIIINSYKGYVTDTGQSVPGGNWQKNSFIFDIINEGNLQSLFIELPQFNSLVVIEGEYSFDRSEFSLIIN